MLSTGPKIFCTSPNYFEQSKNSVASKNNPLGEPVTPHKSNAALVNDLLNVSVALTLKKWGERLNLL